MVLTRLWVGGARGGRAGVGGLAVRYGEVKTVNRDLRIEIMRPAEDDPCVPRFSFCPSARSGT